MRVEDLLDVVGPAVGDRILFKDARSSLTAAELQRAARRLAHEIEARPVSRLVLVAENSVAVPVCLYGAATAGVPFTPVNYRSTDDRLTELVARTAPALVVVDDSMVSRLGEHDEVEMLSTEDVVSAARDAALTSRPEATDTDPTAVLLFTSGTVGEPKSAMLSHSNLTSYVLATVDFAGAAEDEAALVSVPPYHIAGVMAALTGPFAGRRTVYLRSFDEVRWVELARSEPVTHAMVVPTMLDRILDQIGGEGLPELRFLSYGGGPMPPGVIDRALRALPHVDFVNAYGLTETASTVSVLGPDDHRAAASSADPAIRRRLRSVGRALPDVELSVRDAEGLEVECGQRGEVWVRGPQVAGRYAGSEGRAGGWFRTHDAGELDDEGYLYLHGRLDDVIVRGGENLSPGDIEAVLDRHPAVAECAVVGIPDARWGEAVAAAVVPVAGVEIGVDELRDHVRGVLRSTQTPEVIRFYDELPVSETGKLLRRLLREDLSTPAEP